MVLLLVVIVAVISFLLGRQYERQRRQTVAALPAAELLPEPEPCGTEEEDVTAVLLAAAVISYENDCAASPAVIPEELLAVFTAAVAEFAVSGR